MQPRVVGRAPLQYNLKYDASSLDNPLPPATFAVIPRSHRGVLAAAMALLLVLSSSSKGRGRIFQVTRRGTYSPLTGNALRHYHYYYYYFFSSSSPRLREGGHFSDIVCLRSSGLGVTRASCPPHSLHARVKTRETGIRNGGSSTTEIQCLQGSFNA